MSSMNEKIARADKLADELHTSLVALLTDNDDYDVLRILKRSEAEIMDLRHNLSLVRRLKGV